MLYDRRLIKGAEIAALGDRLEARGISVLTTGSPEHQVDLRLAAACLRALAHRDEIIVDVPRARRPESGGSS